MDKQLRFVLSGVDQSASKTIDNVGKHGESAAQKLGGAFVKAGQQIGGELGEVITRTGEGLDHLGEKGLSAGQKIQALGGLAAGTGLLLTVMGSREKQATDQLSQSIENAGANVSDFDGQIEDAVKHMEKYGDTAVATKDALTILTNATHDPAKALTLLATAADLAAASHISLQDAASQIGKALNGSGRIFKQYGIIVQTNADGTKDYTSALEQLAQVVHGQADASANNFTGTLHHLKAEVLDNVAAFGEKFGPSIQTVGAAMTILPPVIGAVSKGFTTMRLAAAGASAATAVATAASFGPMGLVVGGIVGVAGLAATSLGLFGHKAHEAVAPTQELTSAIQADSGALGENTRQVIANKLQSAGAFENASKLGIAQNVLTDALLGNAKAVAAVQAAMDAAKAPEYYREHHEGAKALTESQKEALAAADALQGTMHGLGEEVKVNQTAAQNLKVAQKAAVPTFQSFTDAVKQQSEAFTGLNNRALDAESALIAFKEAETGVTKSVKDNGKSLTDNTTQGRNNLKAVFASIQAAQEHAKAVLAQTGSTDKATAAYKTDIAALSAHLAKLGLEPAAIQAIISKYAKVPKLVKTAVDIKDEATAHLQEVIAGLHRMVTDNGLLISVNTTTGNAGVTKGGTRLGTAGGNEFFPGGRTAIVERGEPEIIAARGVSITPLSKVTGGSSGGHTFNITVNAGIGTDGYQVGRQVAGALEEYFGSGGKIRGLTSAAA